MPYLEFASGAWDPYTACDINQMDKVQRRAARVVKMIIDVYNVAYHRQVTCTYTDALFSVRIS